MNTITEQKIKSEQVLKLFINYVENMWEYARLSAAEKATSLTAAAIGSAMIAFFSGIIIFFLSLGLAFYIGSVMDSIATGFFIVAIGYVVLMIASLIFIKPIIERKISETIINALDNEEEPEQ
jgi:ABC-type bacteriocin/lantibiotic exporter with double-glycine peptidase domain